MPAIDFLERLKKVGKAFAQQARISEDYRRVFNTPEGQRVLIDLGRRNFLLGTTTVGDSDALSYHNEGRRAAMLELLKVLRWNAMDVVALAERADEQDALNREERAA